MALSPEHEAQILRYYHAERWRIGTIAAQLGLHRDTVARVLAQAGLPRHGPVQRASAIDPICPSSTTRSRSFRASRPRGSTTWCAHAVTPGAPITSATSSPGTARARAPRPTCGYAPCPASRPRSTGALRAPDDRARAPSADGLRHGAVVVAPDLSALLPRCAHGELPARPRRRLRVLGRVPRIALYDNLKSAVLERCGNAIRFHPTLLALAGHYRFEPRPVAVARGNEKGASARSATCARPSSPDAPSPIWTT